MKLLIVCDSMSVCSVCPPRQTSISRMFSLSVWPEFPPRVTSSLHMLACHACLGPVRGLRLDKSLRVYCVSRVCG